MRSSSIHLRWFACVVRHGCAAVIASMFVAGFPPKRVHAADQVYWISGSEVHRANLDGGSNQVVVEPLLPTGVALDVAGGKIYWTESFTGRIRRANLDGTSRQTLSTNASVYGIALDLTNQKMLWIEPQAGRIRKANLDGTGAVNVVTGLVDPSAIAIDGTGAKVYWTEYSSNTFNYTISRANLDGTVVQPLITAGGITNGLAIDSVAGKLYWCEVGGAVRRSNLDGTQVGLVYGPPADFAPQGLALDRAAGKLYWTDLENGEIQRVNTNGSSFASLVTGLESPGPIAVDASGGLLYWADVATQKIQRATVSGSNTTTVLGGGAGHPADVALDMKSSQMWWSDSDEFVGRAGLDGANPAQPVPVAFQPGGLAVDASSAALYFGDSLFENVRRASLTGAGNESIVENANPNGMAVDPSGKRIYWADQSSAKVRHSNLDGTGVQDLTPAVGFYDVAIDRVGAKLYLALGNKIQRANLDGSTVQDVVTSGLSGVTSVAVDSLARKLYWIDNTPPGTLVRSDLNGANAVPLVTGIAFPGQGLALTAEARLVFTDGFESSGTSYWSDTVP